jgi:dTDP-4-dehydrorhamnose 3,5-epimerase
VSPLRIIDTPLRGCCLIETSPNADSRGYFARQFCAREFAAHGLNPQIAQTSLSYNNERGTLRGLHFQAYPAAEDKLVACVRGSIFDVMVDLREGSPTFGQWYGAELSEENGRQLYSPRGFAHGFQALTEDCKVLYQIGQFFEPDRFCGVRWNDPEIGVTWPLPPTNVSTRDLSLPLLKEVDRSLLTGINQRQVGHE